MSSIRIEGYVDDEQRLSAVVPSNVSPGPVEVVLITGTNDEDDAGPAWMAGVAHEWHDELADSREDIYTLADGEPVDGAR